MQLSLNLTTAGFDHDTLETIVTITFDNGVITASDLVLVQNFWRFLVTQYANYQLTDKAFSVLFLHFH